MPGLVPGIHALLVATRKNVDGRASPAMTAGPGVSPVGALGWTAPCMLQGRSVQPGKPVISMPIVNRVAELQPEIQAWRRDIHEHPELLYDVHRTAALVADRLREFGCDEVTTGIGRTGVVGVIKGNRPAGNGDVKVIGLRAA